MSNPLFSKENLIFGIYIILILSIASILFSFAVSSILGVIAILFFLFYAKEYGLIFSKKRLLYFAVIILPFLFSITSLLYSVDINYTTKVISKEVTIFLFAIPIFFLPSLIGDKQNFILSIFSYVVVIAYLLSWFKGLAIYFESGRFLYFGNLHKITLIQHNYLGMYGILASFHFLKMLSFTISKWIKVINIIFVLLILSFIILISSRTNIVVILCLLIIFSIYYFLSKKSELKYFLYLSTILIFISFLLFSSSNTIYRFKRVYDDNNNPRGVIWRCSIDLIKENSSFLYGLGSGNVENKLSECISTNSERLDWIDLHTHNQYFSHLLRYGYFQSFLLICSLFYLLILSIKYRNDYLFIVLFSIIVMGLTENYFDRRFGQMYYAFFISMFLLNDIRILKKNKNA